MVGFFHVGAVDGEDHVAFAHTSTISRSVVIHVINVRDHFDFLLLLVMDAVALQRETKRAVFLFDDYGATPAVFFRFRHCYAIGLNALQDL